MKRRHSFQAGKAVASAKDRSFIGITKKDLTGYCFVAPLILGILVFYFYPVLKAFLLSLETSYGSNNRFVGISNYLNAISDTNFWIALYNTLYMGVISVVLDVTCSFILASLINRSPLSAKNVFRSLFFLPNVVSVVASSLMFIFIFYPSNEGLINGVLGAVGISPLGWFSDPSMAPISICLMGLWRSVGYNTIIFLAGLQSVSKELYEASEVDGVNELKKWWYITIPSVKPILAFVVIMDTIGAMRRFSDVWMIGGTSGNPGGSLATVVMYIYRNAFTSDQMGLANAAAYLLFFLIFLLTIMNNSLLNKRNDV